MACCKEQSFSHFFIFHFAFTSCVLLYLFTASFIHFVCSFSSSSVAVCRFPNTGDDWYVLVGVARDMILNPRSVGGGFIYTYRLVSGAEKLEFVHKVGVATRTYW